MQKTLDEIAKLIEGDVVGDANLVITGLSGIKEAKEGDLTFVSDPKYFPLIEKTKASAIITPRELEVSGPPVIRTDNPSLAFAKIASCVVNDDMHRFEGIHETAVVADDARLGKNVSIGPCTVIESEARIGDNTIIYGGCFVGHHTGIGQGCFIYPNCTIREKILIGNQVIIHSGVVIGSDGFGFVNVKGIQEKIPQIGTVEIKDNVEIGANVTIDRARFDKTFIGEGTKIDNLVQIAHNVRIGKHCIICAQVGISGSTIVEDNVVLAGQVGLAGHLTVGEGAIVASGSGVPSSIPPHEMYWGFPAKPHRHAKRVNACVQRLPKYVKTIHELKKKVEDLEEKQKKRKDDV